MSLHNKIVPDDVIESAAKAALDYLKSQSLKISEDREIEFLDQVEFVIDCFLNPGTQPGEELD